jgi:hypothetical protein
MHTKCWYSELKSFCKISSLCVTHLLLFVHTTKYSNYDALNKHARAARLVTVSVHVAPSSGQLHKTTQPVAGCGATFSTERAFLTAA